MFIDDFISGVENRKDEKQKYVYSICRKNVLMKKNFVDDSKMKRFFICRRKEERDRKRETK